MDANLTTDQANQRRRLRADTPQRVSGPASPPRIAELDGLRGLAAVAIVLFHWSPDHVPMGWAAVDLFFVLSGFLITSIIIRQGTARGFLKTFYVRRALRIWPIYYLTVLAVGGVWLFVPQRVYWPGLPYTLTYTQFISRHVFTELPDYSPYLWHTWSLAIEEQFYLIWPLAVLTLGRRRVVPLALGCVGVAVLGRAEGWNWNILGARCDALALGGLLAPLLRRPAPSLPIQRARQALLASAVLAGLIVLLTLAGTVGINLPSGPPPWPALTLLAVNAVWFGIVGLIALHAGSPWLRGLTAHPLTYLGRISYGLYLYHFVCLRVVSEIAQAHGARLNLLGKGAAIALAFPVAALSWRYFEQPLLRWKDRYPYGAGPSRQGSSPARPHSRVWLG